MDCASLGWCWTGLPLQRGDRKHGSSLCKVNSALLLLSVGEPSNLLKYFFFGLVTKVPYSRHRLCRCREQSGSTGHPSMGRDSLLPLCPYLFSPHLLPPVGFFCFQALPSPYSVSILWDSMRGLSSVCLFHRARHTVGTS